MYSGVKHYEISVVVNKINPAKVQRDISQSSSAN